MNILLTYDRPPKGDRDRDTWTAYTEDRQYDGSGRTPLEAVMDLASQLAQRFC